MSIAKTKAEIEVFFDYACPYCLKGHQNLIELLPDFPEIEVVWRPCESHPRPERYGMHSDLLIQGMFFAAENGVDLWEYHERAYSVILKQRINVENIDVLMQCFSDMLDAEKLRLALQDGQYRKAQRESNEYAFSKSGVWVVPAYRMNGQKLDSVENVGVPKVQLREFLAGG